jgi:Superfamily I DNA and RNA helicases|nr:MAG: superfamily I DNA and RNA helicase [Candidatus Nanosalinarum sp. J07AB56]
MTDFKPNDGQRKLIRNHEGIYRVDAGAGTGKTDTVTLRYADILEESDVEPDDLLLLTFTNNAADEMRERVVNECDYDSRELRDAPISTFHSLAKGIIDENGFEAPNLLGIDDSISSSNQIVENEVLEERKFGEFMDSFMSENSQYDKFYRIVGDHSELLDLIKSLASKGIVPEDQGWYRDTGQHLDGDFEDYWAQVQDLNVRQGNRQSKLRDRTSRVFDKCLEDDAPSNREVRGVPHQTKTISSGTPKRHSMKTGRI